MSDVCKQLLQKTFSIVNSQENYALWYSLWRQQQYIYSNIHYFNMVCWESCSLILVDNGVSSKLDMQILSLSISVWMQSF